MACLQKKVYQPFQCDYISLLKNDSLKSVGQILPSTYRVDKRIQGLEAGGTAVYLCAAGCMVVADEL